MAVTQNQFIGRTSGSIGSVTLQKWKRLNVMRSKPTDVYNPRTDYQIEQRADFKAATDFYVANELVLSECFRMLSNKNNPLNYFVKRNFNLFRGQSGSVNVSLIDSLFCGKGDLVRYANQVTHWANGYPVSIASQVYTGVDWNNWDYWTAGIILNVSTGQMFCDRLLNWNGFNSLDSEIFAGQFDVVVGWLFSYSVKYKKFSNTVSMLGQYVEL